MATDTDHGYRHTVTVSNYGMATCTWTTKISRVCNIWAAYHTKHPKLVYGTIYYIPEKSAYTLPLERSCNKPLYLNDDLSSIVLWPRRSFSANRKTRVIYVYIIQHFVSATLPSRCHIPCRHDKEKHWEQCHAEMGLSCVKSYVKSRSMC